MEEDREIIEEEGECGRSGMILNPWLQIRTQLTGTKFIDSHSPVIKIKSRHPTG